MHIKKLILSICKRILIIVEQELRIDLNLHICVVALDGPSPRAFVAKAVTCISPTLLHNDEGTSNILLHLCFLQDEAVIVDDPQTSPETESEKLNV